MAVSTCSGCGEVFNSVGSFDAHRVGSYSRQLYQTTSDGKHTGKVIGHTLSERRCLTVEEMYAKGMLKNDRNRWITEEYTGTFGSRKEDQTKDDETEQSA